jgi:predicted Rossmann fold nucleotide-binding protein DprA/Smf involved in DNA uptake
LKNLKKDLLAINKYIKTLEKKVNSLIVVVDKIEQLQPVRIKSAKKAPAKKAAVKKIGKKTAADIVFAVIDAAGKKGIKTGNLIMTTRFTEKKILNSVYKLKKQGKIKRAGKGLYVKA